MSIGIAFLLAILLTGPFVPLGLVIGVTWVLLSIARGYRRGERDRDEAR